jgi:hypothetical protein
MVAGITDDLTCFVAIVDFASGEMRSLAECDPSASVDDNTPF